MGRASRTFRIFVSSTFSDLKEERNALQRYVFPKLRELCLQHGCRFQAIDLRWGVSEEASLDQQTMKICSDEIKRCRKTTPRPNFTVLLGDRYGWRPLPYEIPALEFEQITSLTTDPCDRELLMRWYQRDDNAEPPVYCLQPRELDLSDAQTDEQRHAARELEFAEWSEAEAELRRILLAAVERLSLNREQKLKYVASATEQEIEAGAMKVDDANEHVFCFFRTIRNLPADESAKDFVDLRKNGEELELDSEAHARQHALREERLRGKLPGNIFDYECEWKATRDSEMSARCKNPIEVITNRLAELTKERQGLQFAIEDLDNLRERKARALQEAFNAHHDDAEEIESPISLAHIPELCADLFLSLAKVILEEITRMEEATRSTRKSRATKTSAKTARDSSSVVKRTWTASENTCRTTPRTRLPSTENQAQASRR